MKKNNNKGISLVELMVALAVLAVLMVAVIGLMSTYVTIYRNRKSAKAVQDSAEAAFDEIEFTLSQAESITISGYTFSGTEKDMNFSDDVASDKFSGKLEYATYKKIVDIKNVSNGGEGAGANGSNKILYANVKVTRNGYHKIYPNEKNIKYKSRNGKYVPYIGDYYYPTYLFNTYSDYGRKDEYDPYSTDPLYYTEYGYYTEIFQVLPENIKELNSMQYEVYVKEINERHKVYKSDVTFIYGQANVEEDKNDKVRDFSYLKNGSEYSDLYVKTITVVYSVPLDMMYLDKEKQSLSTDWDGYHYLLVGGKRVDKDNYDTCTVTYTFEGSKMTLTRKYKYMVKLNETATVENSEFSNYMKHRTDGTNDVAGIVAKVDGENDSISFKLYFGEGKNSYTIEKIVNMKNSYVMHVAN